MSRHAEVSLNAFGRSESLLPSGAAERSLCPAEEGARGGGECALVGHAQEPLLSLSFSYTL